MKLPFAADLDQPNDDGKQLMLIKGSEVFLELLLMTIFVIMELLDYYLYTKAGSFTGAPT